MACRWGSTFWEGHQTACVVVVVVVVLTFDLGGCALERGHAHACSELRRLADQQQPSPRKKKTSTPTGGATTPCLKNTYTAKTMCQNPRHFRVLRRSLSSTMGHTMDMANQHCQLGHSMHDQPANRATNRRRRNPTAPTRVTKTKMSPRAKASAERHTTTHELTV